MVRLPVAVDETLEPVVVPYLLVSIGGDPEPEDDLLVVVRGREGEDPLGPVADLGLPAQVDLARDRADESAGELTVTGHAGPVEPGTEVGPQFGKSGDPFDLGRADQLVVDVGDLAEASLTCNDTSAAGTPGSERRTADSGDEDLDADNGEDLPTRLGMIYDGTSKDGTVHDGVRTRMLLTALCAWTSGQFCRRARRTDKASLCSTSCPTAVAALPCRSGLLGGEVAGSLSLPGTLQPSAEPRRVIVQHPARWSCAMRGPFRCSGLASGGEEGVEMNLNDATVPSGPEALDEIVRAGHSQRTLGLSRVASSTRVLGPGLRAVVWVHGCPLRCPGCVAPEDLPFEGGERWSVPALAAWLSALPAHVTGLTLSGGEPMSQAAALADLVDLIRAGRDWSVMAFSGFTLARLRRSGDEGQQALLERLDILVDGPYLEARHADLLWRGSDNQQIHYLTDRHRAPAQDRGAGVEVTVADGSLQWIGVPPVPGFRSQFESAMSAQGVELVPREEN